MILRLDGVKNVYSQSWIADLARFWQPSWSYA